MVTKRVEYPISKDYCGNWTVKDALRELIANALDASDKIKLSWRDGVGRIRDNGDGLTKKSLLVGFSGKASDQIGQFGEGLKIAALALCRQGKTIEIVSKTAVLQFCIEYSEEYDSEILVAYHQDVEEPIEGTLVRVGCSEEEFNDAKDLFIRFSQTKRVPVEVQGAPTSYVLPDDPGRIFVMGVYVAHVHAAFGYDLHFKEMVNRDRAILNQNQLNTAVQKVWNNCADENLIVEFLRRIVGPGLPTDIERTVYIRPNAEVLGEWKRLLEPALGKRTCMDGSASDTMKALAMERRWRLLTGLAYWVQDLLRNLGMKTVSDVLGDGVLREGLVQHSNLSAPELANLELVKSLVTREFGKIGRIKVYEKLDVDELVRSRSGDGCIELLRTVLEDQDELLRLLIKGCIEAEQNESSNQSYKTTDELLLERYARTLMALFRAQSGDETSQVGAC